MPAVTSPRERRPRNPGRVLRVLLVAALAMFAALEIAARAMTRESANGMPRVGRVPLLPLRPTAEVIERCLARNSSSTYIVHDAELGWSIGKSGESEVVAGEPLYVSNDQGVRADRDRVYAADPPPGKVRIVTVGDSFTHCDEVSNSQTWQRYLEDSRGDLEVVNLGVPGYGTDQALMRWRRDGRQLRSQIVVLGIWPENMCRNLSLFRYYLVPAESFACKPRMVVDGGELRVIDSPVPDSAEMTAILTEPESHPVLADDFWFREREARAKPFECVRILRVAESVLSMYERKRERSRLYSGADPAGIDITVAIAQQFAREVREAGAVPLVLVIPMRDLLAMHASSELFPLVAALRAHGVDVIDIGREFAKAAGERGADTLYAGTGHHSPEGNRLVAELLGRELEPWLAEVQR